MTFEKWDNETWKVTVRDEEHIELTIPGSVCVFNKHDFLELQHNINMIDLFEKEDGLFMMEILLIVLLVSS